MLVALFEAYTYLPIIAKKNVLLGYIYSLTHMQEWDSVWIPKESDVECVCCSSDACRDSGLLRSPVPSYCSPTSAYCIPMSAYCSPTSSYCIPTSTYCIPTSSYCIPTSAYCRRNTFNSILFIILSASVWFTYIYIYIYIYIWHILKDICGIYLVDMAQSSGL